MVEQVLPHLVLYPDAEDVSPADADVGAHRLEHVYSQHHGEHRDHEPHVPVCDRAIQKIVGQQREQHGQERRDDRDDHVQHKKAHMRAVV